MRSRHNQRSPSHYFWQDTSINAVNHITLGKTQESTRSIKLLRARQKSIQSISSDVFTPFARPVYRFGSPKLWRPKSTFQVFFFQLYFNKKYVEVAINRFIMYQIISKWLKIQKCRQKSKTMRQRCRNKRRRKCLRKCLHSFTT